MDIAALSINMHTANLVRDVNLSVIKKSMETEETIAENLLKMLPPTDSVIDVRV